MFYSFFKSEVRAGLGDLNRPDGSGGKVTLDDQAVEGTWRDYYQLIEGKLNH